MPSAGRTLRDPTPAPPTGTSSHASPPTAPTHVSHRATTRHPRTGTGRQQRQTAVETGQESVLPRRVRPSPSGSRDSTPTPTPRYPSTPPTPNPARIPAPPPSPTPFPHSQPAQLPTTRPTITMLLAVSPPHPPRAATPPPAHPPPAPALVHAPVPLHRVSLPAGPVRRHGGSFTPHSRHRHSSTVAGAPSSSLRRWRLHRSPHTSTPHQRRKKRKKRGVVVKADESRKGTEPHKHRILVSAGAQRR